MSIGALLSVALPTFLGVPMVAGDHLRTIQVGGQMRTYLVHLPPGHDPKTPAPVVLAFHSAAMNGAAMARFSGLNETADRAGFIAVYPNGTGATPYFLYWDAGGVRGRPSDDVGFVAGLLDDLATVLNIDARRVYATGMSNGAMMCYRLAAELSNRIAAIAPVAGTMAIERCQPLRPVPVLHFHGTADGLVLFTGPDERTPENLKFQSVEQTVRGWARTNGCPEAPARVEAIDRVDDGTTVQRRVYGPGKDGSEVILYVIEGGGHTWPGRDPRSRLLGKSTREIAANDVIWDFFRKHPMN